MATPTQPSPKAASNGISKLGIFFLIAACVCNSYVLGRFFRDSLILTSFVSFVGVLALLQGVVLVFLKSFAARKKELLDWGSVVIFFSLLFIGAEIGARKLMLNIIHKDDSAGGRQSQAYKDFAWSERFFRTSDSIAAAIGDNRNQGLGYEPYVLWKAKDWGSDLINSKNGYRVTTNPNKSAQDTLTVFAFGGSTMFCLEGPDSLTISSLLSKYLNEAEPVQARRFEVHNFGMGAYVSDQQTILLTQLLQQGKVPDIVVVYDGANDVEAKIIQGIPHAHYKEFSNIGKSSFTFGVIANKLMERVYVLQLLRYWVSGHDDKPAVLDIPKETFKERTEQVLTSYVGKAQFIKHLADAYNFRYFHFWQPVLATSGKQLSEDEQRIRVIYNPQYPEGPKKYREVLAEANAVVFQKIQAQKAVGGIEHFYDLTHSLDTLKRSVFLDFCHVTPAANEIVARAIANTIVSNLAAKPLSSRARSTVATSQTIANTKP